MIITYFSKMMHLSTQTTQSADAKKISAMFCPIPIWLPVYRTIVYRDFLLKNLKEKKIQNLEPLKQVIATLETKFLWTTSVLEKNKIRIIKLYVKAFTLIKQYKFAEDQELLYFRVFLCAKRKRKYRILLRKTKNYSIKSLKQKKEIPLRLKYQKDKNEDIIPLGNNFICTRRKVCGKV